MDITYLEVRDSVYHAKLRKASGFDGIPSEILRFDICIELLYKIISYCFRNGEIPTEWTKGIIYPIPKSDSKDARDPLNYRGIVNNRKLSRQSTYVCFIDFKKAFDTVQRDLLWYKLMSIWNNGTYTGSYSVFVYRYLMHP